MYNLTQYVKNQGFKTPTDEQLKQMRQTQEYLKKHKVNQLFNQMMAKLIQTKPQNIKQGIADILKQLKNKSTFFKKSDFEQMFDSYNFFEEKSENKISYIYLIQALKRITVNYQKQEFLEVYPKYKLDRMVTKLDFVNILQSQYKNVTKFHS